MGRLLGQWIASRLTRESRPGYPLFPITIYERGPRQQSEMRENIDIAEQWLEFKENPPYILGGRINNDLGHAPGCTCRWC